MALTARQVEATRPKEKDYKLSDERGLYPLVKITGAHCWQLKCQIAGEEKKLAPSIYPDVSLVKARIKRSDARKIISEGGSPGEKKWEEKLTQKIPATSTLHVLVTRWHQYKSLSWSKSHARSVLEVLDKDIFPYLGRRSVTDILSLEMLETPCRTEKRGSLGKLHKMCQYCNQIFHYVIATGRATVNPASEPTGTLATLKAAHFPHLRTDGLPISLREPVEYHGSPATRMAANLLLPTGLRTIELRSTEWPEIDFDNAL